MMIIWKDTTRSEAIFYREGHPMDDKIVTPNQVEELMKEPLIGDEFIITSFHLPGFDGPWPTQEQLDYAREHRFDFLKDAKWMMLNYETGELEELK